MMNILEEIQNCPVEWKELGEVTDTVTSPVKLTKKEYKVSGEIPIVDQGEQFIAGFSDYGKAEHILGERESYSWRATRVDGMIYYDDDTAMGDRGRNGSLHIRSVVRLRPTTKLQKSTNASNSGGTPHKILEY